MANMMKDDEWLTAPDPDDIDYAEADAEQDYPHLPDAADASLDQVSRMLRALRRITAKLAEYNALHAAELTRLDSQRERHTGPLVKRYSELHHALESYGRRAFQDFGKTRIATPNGTIIVGRQLVDELDIDDPSVVAEVPWFSPLAQARVIIPKDELRAKLAELIETGFVRRAIRGRSAIRLREPAPDVYEILAGDERRTTPLRLGETGVFVRVLVDTVNSTNSYEEIPGLRWAPVGTDGLGRNVKVSPA